MELCKNKTTDNIMIINNNLGLIGMNAYTSNSNLGV